MLQWLPNLLRSALNHHGLMLLQQLQSDVKFHPQVCLTQPVTKCFLIIFIDMISLCGVLGSCQRLLLLDMKMFTGSALIDSLFQTGWLPARYVQTAFFLVQCACSMADDNFCAKLWTKTFFLFNLLCNWIRHLKN